MRMKLPMIKWLYPLFIVACYISAHSIASQCPEDQKSLLLKLQSSLAFYPSATSKLAHWNQSTDCCHWSGVTCDPSNGEVIGLDLSNEGISESIDNSSSLFQMWSLRSLNLAYNSDLGAIPPALGKLTSLTYLNLSFASFTGQVPIEISNLTNLRVLDISTYVFQTFETSLDYGIEIPNPATIIQNMTNLRELYLDGVDLSANGKVWCQALSSSCPHLQVFSMSGCDLRDEFHSALANLRSLSVIRLDENHLSGPVPESFATFTNLTTLSLTLCGLMGTFPLGIFQIPKLETVDLSENYDLTGTLPKFPMNGSMQTLKLSQTKFSGFLPHSIGNLKRLRTIDLGDCSFVGIIPSSIASLSLLEEVDLSGNEFSGPLPSFSLAKNLSWLYVSDNNLNGSVTTTDWGGLLNLRSLDLSINSLTGSVPTSVISAPSLGTLSFLHNKLSGRINEFESIPSSKLGSLDLSHNSLEGSIPQAIFQLRSLWSLDLSSNRFNGTLELNESLHPLNFLEVLDLSNNQIQGKVPRWIWNISDRLFSLNLSCNYFVDLAQPIPHAPSLLTLDLHSNSLQGELPSLPFPKESHIAYLDWSNSSFTSINPNIGNSLFFAKFFSIAKNNINGEIPLSLCHAPMLQVIDLGGNHLNGTICGCLTALRTLGVLNLSGNNLRGLIPDEFEEGCPLETLNLDGNFLQGRFPRSLVNCTRLKVLDFGDNRLNDTFPCELKSLSLLQVLILRSNNFSGSTACSEKKSMWQSLQILDLASNHFSGELTEQFIFNQMTKMDGTNKSISKPDNLHYGFIGHNYYQDEVSVTFKGNSFVVHKILTIFTSIDLSDNAFHGEVPSELGNLTALVVLNLSHNSLSGNIPSSFGNLRQVESLDLSCNALSGNIPQELANLNFLQYLNLSFNTLEGPIPTSTQLQSFDASSYEGNQGLYGPPLTPIARRRHAPGLMPSISSTGSNWSSKSEVEWMVRGAEVGFSVGLTIFIGPLLYIKRWRRCYCNHLKRLVMKVMRREDQAKGGGRITKRGRRQQQQRH